MTFPRCGRASASAGPSLGPVGRASVMLVGLLVAGPLGSVALASPLDPSEKPSGPDPGGSLLQRCERNVKQRIPPPPYAALWHSRTDNYARGLQVCEEALIEERQRGAGGAMAAVLDLIGEGQAHVLENLTGAEEKKRIAAHQRAVAVLEEARSLHRQAGDRGKEARSLYRLGYVNRARRRHEAALPQLAEALTLARSHGDTDLQARIHLQRGVLERQRDQPRSAVAELLRARDLAPTTGQQVVRRLVQFHLGLAYHDLEREREADGAFEVYLAITRQVEGASGEAEALERLGGLFSQETRRDLLEIGKPSPRASRDHSRAELLYQRALAIRRQEGDRVGQARILSNIGRAQYQQNRFADAFRTHRQALEVASRIADQEEQQTVLQRFITKDISAYQHDHPEMAIDLVRQELALHQARGNRLHEAGSLAFLGHIYYYSQQFQPALEQRRRALAIYRELGDTQREATMLHALGRMFVERGTTTRSGATPCVSELQFRQSLRFYTQSFDLRRRRVAQAATEAARNELSKDLAEDLEKVAGQFHQWACQPRQALLMMREARDLHRRLGDNHQEAGAVARMANLALALGEVERAQALDGELIRMEAEGPGASSLPSRIQFMIARKYVFSGHYQVAMNLHRQAIQLVQQKTLPAAQADALRAYAGTLRTIAQHGTWQELKKENPAVEFLEVNERLLRERLPEAWIEQHREALDLLKRALRLYRAQPDSHKVAWTLTEMAEVNGLLGNPEGEAALRREAWQWAERHGNEGQALNLLERLADWHGARNEQREALALYRRLRDQQRKRGDLSEVASIEHKIAALHRQLGHWESARQHEQRALELRLQKGQFAIASLWLVEMAERTHEAGDHAGAGELFDRAVAVKEKEGKPAQLQFFLARIGQKLLERNDPARALPHHLHYIRMVTAEGDRVQEIEARHRLARVWRHHGQHEQALRFYRQALARGQELRSRPGQASYDGVAISLAGIGAVLAEQDHPEEAIAFYKAAINSVEGGRRRFTGSAAIPASFIDIALKRHSQAYRELADLLLVQGRILEAQEVLERLKTSEIQQHQKNLRAVASAEGLVLSEAEREVLERHGSLLRFARRVAACDEPEADCPDASTLNAQRAQLVKEFNSSMRKEATRLRERRAVDPHFLDPGRNRRKLSNHIVRAEPGTVVIYPLVLPERLWLLWIAPGEVAQRIEVPVSQRELGEAVLRFRQLLEQQGDLAELKRSAQKLHGWLVQPLEQELGNNDIHNLVFALDRVVRYVPMAALHDGHQFLLEKYRISTILSTQLTDMSQRSPMAPGQLPLLALGVSEGGGGFGALPFVKEEIDGIVREGDGDPEGIYPGRSFLDASFDLTALRDNLHAHQALHIASHAQVGRDPGEAFLLMGNGRRLQLEDIQDELPNLNRLELVVLSACGTALGGPDADGIEIAGLGAQFMQDDGARAVVASLWSVADASTSELMQGLYRQLAAGAGRAEALRRAQLALLRGKGSEGDGFSHPFHWAPFVLTGNPR